MRENNRILEGVQGEVMKRIEFKSIGNYEIIKKVDNEPGSVTKIILEKGLEKAMIKLNHFSHCLVFTKGRNRLFCYGTKMLDLQEKIGEIVIEENNMKGEIVDIKPYFPCEERVEGIYRKQKSTIIPFDGNTIGEYLFINNSGLMKFHETGPLSCD